MHKRYINHRLFGGSGFSGLWTLLIALSLPCTADAFAIDSAHDHVMDALQHSVPAAFTAPVDFQVSIHSPRGAANSPCPQAWQWGALDIRQWQRIHVPVLCGKKKGSWVASVRAATEVWTTRTTLPSGHVLQRHDLQRIPGTVHSAQELFSIDNLEHMLLRLEVPAGTRLVPAQLQAPVYAQRGQAIEIRAMLEGITVSAPGIATEVARKGEITQVQNVQSQASVSGQFIAPQVFLAAPEQSHHGGVKVELESFD